LSGGSGYDYIVGGAGADMIDGGDGQDAAVFEYAPIGITLDFLDALANRGDAAGDSYANVENIDGSAFGDTLLGDHIANQIRGAAGDDTIYGRGGNDVLEGGLGSDILVGDAGDDQIFGGDGKDSLHGGDGSDYIDGGIGNDELYAGAGDDTLSGGDGDGLLVGGAGADDLQGGAGAYDAVSYYSSVESVTVDLSNIDNNRGDAAGDQYRNIEYVYGSAFADTLRGDANSNTLIGEAGNDFIYGGGGLDSLHGGLGNDIIHTESSTGEVYGDDGADTIYGGINGNNLLGGAGNDAIYGGAGGDTLQGQDGFDKLSGEEGDDFLYGGAGNDELIGGAGNDLLYGQEGNDTAYLSSFRANGFDGGDGIDTADFSANTTGIDIDLRNIGDSHRLANVESAIGGSGNDTIRGSDTINQLDGGAGNDTILGSLGADTVIGGDGIDTVSYADSAMGNGAARSDAVGEIRFTPPTPGTAFILPTTILTLDGVIASLSGTTGAGSDAQGDIITSVENLTGSRFGDQLTGTSTDNILSGGDGADLIYGRDGNDRLYGGAGDDVLYGEMGNDWLEGSSGNDRLFGGGQSDVLLGGAGNDYLDAGDAGDVLKGEGGDDILIGGQGGDTYHIGRNGGNDTIYNYDNDRLNGNAANDVIVFESNIPGIQNIENTDLWFQKSGRDLIVSLIGGGTQTTIKDIFTTTTAGDYATLDDFVVDVLIAGQRVAGRQVNLPALLTLMQGRPVPQQFLDLNETLRTQINSAWGTNQAPTVALVPGQLLSVKEDGTLAIAVTVGDAETSVGGITLEAEVNGILRPAQIQRTGEGTYTVNVTGLAGQFGTGTLSLRAFDGGIHSALLDVPITVTPEANGLILNTAQTSFAVNVGSAIALPGLSVALKDNDGSETIEDLFIDGLPSGAILASGTHSFTANATNGSSVNIRGWNGGNLQQTLASLTVTPPAGSGTDFTLRLRGRSRDGNAASGFVTSSEAVSADILARVNAAPTGVALSPSAFNENVAGAFVGTLSALGDPDGTGSYRYEIVGGADRARFTLGTNNSQLFLAPGQSLNFEAGDAEVQVRVVDITTGTALNGGTSSFRISPANVPEAPGTPAQVTNASINDGDGAGRIVSNLTLSAVDEDGGNLTFEILGGSNLFEVFGTQIRVRAGQIIDFDGANGATIPFHDLNIIARDSTNLASVAARSIRITVNPVDEAPTLQLPQSIDLSEAATGTWGGITLSGIDPEGHGVSFAIDQNPGRGAASAFTIVGSTLRLNGALDYDGTLANFSAISPATGVRSTTIYIQSAAGAGPKSGYQAFTFNLFNVDERPSAPAIVGPLNLFENASFSQVLALGSVDPEGAEVDYSFALTNGVISGNPGGLFVIDNVVGSDATIRLRAPFDFETVKKQNYYTRIDDNSGTITVSLLAVDANLNQTAIENIADTRRSVVRDITITVNNVDERPTNSVSSNPNVTVNENATGFTGVTFDARDEDGDQVNYIFRNGTTKHGNLELIGHGLHIVGTGFDFETLGGTLDVEVFAYSNARDANGNLFPGLASLQPVNQRVTITNLNDVRPTIGNFRWNAGYEGGVIRENLLLGTPVATFSVSDADTPLSQIQFQFSNPALRAQYSGVGNDFKLVIDNGFDYESASVGGVSGVLNAPNIEVDVHFTAYDGAAGSAEFEGETQNITVRVKDEDRFAGGNYTYYLLNTDVDSGIYQIAPSVIAFKDQSIYTVNGNNGIDDRNYDALKIVQQLTIINTLNNEVIFEGYHENYPFNVSGYQDLRLNLQNGYQYLDGTASDGFTASNVFRELPIVLDLNGDGLDLIGLDTSTVRFDHNGDGILDRTGYVGANDGLLVLDRNRNGTIDNGSEISFVGDRAGATTDLEGLAGLDSDNDGFITAGDARFGELQVWQDSNQDGISQASELRSLTQAGIVSITLGGTRTGQTLENTPGNVLFATTQFTRTDGSQGLAGDVALAYVAGTNANTTDGTPPLQPVVRNPASATTTPVPPILESTPVPPPPSLAFQAIALEGRSRNFMIAPQNGALSFAARKANGPVDSRAGAFGGATILQFSDRTIGFATAIILDLDGDGIEMRGRTKSAAQFDFDGDGIADDTGWVGKGDGLLVLDRNGDGLITGASEVSFLSDDATATSSFDALTALDDNADRRLDAADRRFSQLRVWVDSNRNGISDAGELRSLADLSITSIGLNGQPVDLAVKAGKNTVFGTSSFTLANGSTRSLGSVALTFTPSSATAVVPDAVGISPREGGAGDGLNAIEARFSALREALSEDFASAAAPATVGDFAQRSAIDPRIAQMVQAMSIFDSAPAAESNIRMRRESDVSQNWLAVSAV
jgi:Ca2+-binding RTX toxin-like protein